MDCSAFATLCDKAAGEPDPNGLNYNPIGWTGTLWAHGKETNNPQPGDLCFYGTEVAREAGVPVHVTICIGGGQELRHSPALAAITAEREGLEVERVRMQSAEDSSSA